MPFCFKLTKDICGTPIRNIVNFAFCHFIIHGIFVTSFVFSNTSYPPFYYVDYLYGISGAVLIVVAIAGILLASMRECQILRSIWAAVVSLDVLTCIVGSIYYAVERWHDVITTAFTRALRKPLEKDYPDYLWYTATVIGCLMLLPFIFYLIYILSYMCNKYQGYLFTFNYDEVQYNPFYHGMYGQTVTVPHVPQSNAYPTQK